MPMPPQLLHKPFDVIASINRVVDFRRICRTSRRFAKANKLVLLARAALRTGDKMHVYKSRFDAPAVS
jgi:hypothetical protein